jgi:hypothetical protein
MVGAAAPLTAIPTITASFGTSGWAAVAIGLAIGGAAAVIAELGWSVIGPQQVAADPAAAHDLYEQSIATRLIGVGVCGPLATTGAWFVSETHHEAAALLALAVTTTALSPSWFLIGSGRPWAILATETAPRCVAVLGAVLLMVAGAPLAVYGTALLVAGVATSMLAGQVIGGTRWPSRAAFAAAPAQIRRQGVIVAGRGVSTLYTALPAALLGVVAPSGVAVFAALDRPLRMGLSVLSAVPARLQRWIGSAPLPRRAARSDRSIVINAALGIVGGCVVVLVLPSAVDLLFDGRVHADFDLVALEALLTVVVCSSRGVGLALVAADDVRSISIAVVAAALVGTTGVLAGGILAGVTGAIAGLVAAEVVGLTVQAVRLRRARRERGIEVAA